MSTYSPLAVLAALACGISHAQSPSLATSLGLAVYPSGGQSADTQASDEGACYQWAQQTTGIDPMRQPATPAQAPPPDGGAGGGAAAGAFVGAAGGALIADIADADTRGGAWAGALIGGARGAREHQVRRRAAEQQAAAQANDEVQQRLATFNKGFAACLEGKRYTVK